MSAENAKVVTIRLGDLKPNRFRDLERWPLERGVIEELKQSIDEFGFWNGLQAVRNERGEVELCFGHHRLYAALEAFGSDHEIAIEVAPFQGEWSLLRVLHAENTIKRNPASHLHEIVSQVMPWWDDSVFEKYPTWEAFERSGVFSRPLLEEYFGPSDGNRPGVASYAKCARYGIGRDVIVRMLGGAVSADSVRHALENLPPTRRRAQGLRLRIEENRLKAGKLLAEVAQFESEREVQRQQGEEVFREQRDKIDQLVCARRQAKLVLESAQGPGARGLAEERHRQLEGELDSERRKLKAARKLAAERLEESDRVIRQRRVQARRAEDDAAWKERTLELRDWFDPRAAEVFSKTIHGAAFRDAVCRSEVRPFLESADLVPFARAVRSELERESELSGRELVNSATIRNEVLRSFRSFKSTLRLQAKIRQEEVQRNNPVHRLIRRVEVATQILRRADTALVVVMSEIRTEKIVSTDLHRAGSDFIHAISRLEETLERLHKLGIGNPRPTDRCQAKEAPMTKPAIAPPAGG